MTNDEKRRKALELVLEAQRLATEAMSDVSSVHIHLGHAELCLAYEESKPEEGQHS